MGAAGSSGGLRGQGSLSSEAALRGQASRCLGKMLQAEGAAEGKGLGQSTPTKSRTTGGLHRGQGVRGAHTPPAGLTETAGQGGKGRGVHTPPSRAHRDSGAGREGRGGEGPTLPPAGLTETAGTEAFTLSEKRADGQLSAGRPFQAEREVTLCLTGLGHRMCRELPAWGATLEMLRRRGSHAGTQGREGGPPRWLQSGWDVTVSGCALKAKTTGRGFTAAWAHPR